MSREHARRRGTRSLFDSLQVHAESVLSRIHADVALRHAAHVRTARPLGN
jgi:hypothetical protein